MLGNDTPMYLEPHRCTTRASEVAREKSGKELVSDNVNLLVKDVIPKDKCQISNDLQLHQALTRRALSCDFMQVCTYREMELASTPSRSDAVAYTSWIQAAQHGDQACREGHQLEAQGRWVAAT